MLILLNIIGWIESHWRQSLVALGIGVVLISVAYWAYCGKSRTEKRIEDRAPVIQEQQTGVNQAVNLAVNANIEVNKAQTEVNRVRADKQTNVSIDIANRNRCIAFPESSECR